MQDAAPAAAEKEESENTKQKMISVGSVGFNGYEARSIGALRS